jgi:hypothetical protein
MKIRPVVHKILHVSRKTDIKNAVHFALEQAMEAERSRGTALLFL